MGIRQATARKMLRAEFADFFTAMVTPSATWPALTDQELIDALADALVAMGKRRGLGIALLQTMVHELQDRVNAHTN